MKKVLILEDEPDLRELFVEMLSELYEVVTATNGVEGIAAIEKDTFDAILLDLMMPVMDGVSFAEEIHRRGIDTPIVVVSAMPAVEAISKKLGAIDFCHKPCAPSRLHEALTAALSSAA